MVQVDCGTQPQAFVRRLPDKVAMHVHSLATSLHPRTCLLAAEIWASRHNTNCKLHQGLGKHIRPNTQLPVHIQYLSGNTPAGISTTETIIYLNNVNQPSRRRPLRPVQHVASHSTRNPRFILPANLLCKHVLKLQQQLRFTAVGCEPS